MNSIDQIMRMAPVIPVLVIDHAGQAKDLAQALVRGGLRVLEVTLRTSAALEAISQMRTVEGAIVGAGTVTNSDQLNASMAAGAEFIVSPGLTDDLGRAALDAQVPFLPGIATSGEIMRGLDLGLSHFKFFPAMAAGGIPALKALAAPFAHARFCPTGGISAESAPSWLALEAVLCVGGSWVVPTGANLGEVEALALQASALAAKTLHQ